MKGDRLPPGHHVARHCRKNDLIWSGLTPTGVLESAFQPDQDGLSVTWLEFFGGPDRQVNLAGVKRVQQLTPKKSNRLAVLHVVNVELVGIALQAPLHVIEDPYDVPPPGNPAHALVKEAASLTNQRAREAIAATVGSGDLEPY